MISAFIIHRRLDENNIRLSFCIRLIDIYNILLEINNCFDLTNPFDNSQISFRSKNSTG